VAGKILIINSGIGVGAAVRAARQMGVRVVAMHGSEDSSLLAEADERVLGNILEPADIVRVARAAGVDGIMPAPEPAVAAVARAAEELGLPGVPAELVGGLRNKDAMRATFARCAIANPEWRAVRDLVEARAAAHAIGLPLIVKPADGFGAVGVRRLDYFEDLPLLFAQASQHSYRKTVLLESRLAGAEYVVDCVVRGGTATVTAITGKTKAGNPWCFDTGIFTPPAIAEMDRAKMLAATERAIEALGIKSGALSVEMILTESGPIIIEMSAYPSALRTPVDLSAYIHDNAGNTILGRAAAFALGEPMRPIATAERGAAGRGAAERGAALVWIPSHSGIVTEVARVEEARALPDVREVSIAIQPGHKLGHITDCAGRDRIGYIVATAGTAEAAICAAQQAVDVCSVVTRPVL
jgi:phosphoribosylaminoimidazole carboxylase (NCAIR synthetase)